MSPQNRSHWVLGSSPSNNERELGLDCRETHYVYLPDDMPDTTATLQSRRGCRRFRHLVRSQHAKAGEEPTGHLWDYGTSLWEWSSLLNATIGRVTEAQVTLKRHCQKGWCGAKSHWRMYQGGRKKELQSPAAHCRSWVDTVLQPSPVGFSF